MKLSHKEIISIMRESGLDCFGLRADKAGYKSGMALDVSHQWFQDYQDYWENDWDGDQYDDPYHPYNSEIECWDDGELSGTSALYIDADMSEDQIDNTVRNMRYYLYKGYSCVYLIGGDSCECGNDVGETIISNARVLALVLNK